MGNSVEMTQDWHHTAGLQCFSLEFLEIYIVGKILIVFDFRNFILFLKIVCISRKETRCLEGGLWKH